MNTLADCLSSQELEILEKAFIADSLLSKSIDDLTIKDIKFVAAKLHNTNFSYGSDVLKLIKAILA